MFRPYVGRFMTYSSRTKDLTLGTSSDQGSTGTGHVTRDVLPTSPGLTPNRHACIVSRVMPSTAWRAVVMAKNGKRQSGAQTFIIVCLAWLIMFVPLSCVLGWFTR